MTNPVDKALVWLDVVQLQLEVIQERLLPLAVRRYPHLTRQITPYLASLSQIKVRLANGEPPTREDLQVIRWAIQQCGDVDLEMFVAEACRSSPSFDAFYNAEQHRAARGESR